MAGQLPSLALEMSMDGIALYQLAFDGHWHELSRVSLSDAALREKMANMRSIAQRLEGRRFKVRVWLPSDQIIKKTSPIESGDPRARDKQARQVLEKASPHSGSEFAVAVAELSDDDSTWIAAARYKTLREAFTFAKSHGFNATVYSCKDPIEGFSDKPYFKLPPNRFRVAALGTLGAVLLGSIVVAGIAFKISDPYLWWEKPPEVASFAPFQQPSLAADRSNDNILPTKIDPPNFNDIAGLSAFTLRDAMPYIPQRRLDAPALDFVSEPPLLFADDFDVTYSTMAEIVRLSLPLEPTNIAAPESADRPPSLGLYNLFTNVVAIKAPALPENTATALLPTSLANVSPATQPLSIATLRFSLEPLPSIAVTMPYEMQRELESNFGIVASALPRPFPTILADNTVVQVTRGLPDLLPKLRSGRPIPPQVAVLEIQPEVIIVETIPADPETIAAAERGFRIIQGRPDIIPTRRFVPPVAEPPVIEAAPVITETVITPETTEPEIAVLEAPADLPAFVGEIPVFSGQPDLLPVLRSGAEIPAPLAVPEVTTEPIPEAVATSELPVAGLVAPETTDAAEIDPAMAIINALRAKRRPQAIAEMAQPVDPMLSDAAPAVAVVPSHRNESSASNAARIAELNADRPHAVAPVVPADPQTVSLPTSASVARAATIENGINLNKTSLIGIFGTADNREVLIRLASGRILQVSLGESFSGWRVIAISDDSIRIQRGNRTEILRLPN